MKIKIKLTVVGVLPKIQKSGYSQPPALWQVFIASSHNALWEDLRDETVTASAVEKILEPKPVR